MSLARLALRLATVLALRGATMAEGRVRDSALSDLDAILERDQAPIITVSTEATERKGAEPTQQTRLVIELALLVKVRDPSDATGSPVLGIPETDSELDFMLDLFEREVLDALADPQNAAADLWRAIILGAPHPNSPGHEYSSIRGIGAAGQRLAARQILIATDLVLDPARGDAVPDWLARLLALLENDAEFAALHDLLAGFLARTSGADFREQARLFLDGAVARALSVVGLAQDDAGAPILLAELAAGDIDAPADTRE